MRPFLALGLIAGAALPAAAQVTASDPVEIILPGQPDFGTVESRPGCGPAQ